MQVVYVTTAFTGSPGLRLPHVPITIAASGLAKACSSGYVLVSKARLACSRARRGPMLVTKRAILLAPIRPSDKCEFEGGAAPRASISCTGRASLRIAANKYTE